MRIIRFIAAMLVSLVLLAAPAAAADYDTGTFGASRGSQFAQRCPANTELVGVYARSGPAIYAIAAACGSGGRPPVRSDWAGTSLGEPVAVLCPAGAVNGLLMQFRGGDARSGTLAAVGMNCPGGMICLETGGGCTGHHDLAPGEYGGDSVTGTRVHCKPGEAIVGLVGWASAEGISALGAICGAKPMTLLQGAPVRGDLPRIEVPIMGPPGGASPITEIKEANCRPGFQPRYARVGDIVCVTPESAARVMAENGLADSRRAPDSAYGPDGCIAGFVWRDAFSNDRVCVEPAVRDIVQAENRSAAERSY
jgi:hypothetical protein